MSIKSSFNNNNRLESSLMTSLDQQQLSNELNSTLEIKIDLIAPSSSSSSSSSSGSTKSNSQATSTQIEQNKNDASSSLASSSIGTPEKLPATKTDLDDTNSLTNSDDPKMMSPTATEMPEKEEDNTKLILLNNDDTGIGESNTDDLFDDQLPTSLDSSCQAVKMGETENAGYCIDSVEPKCNELKRLIEEVKLDYKNKIDAFKKTKYLIKKLNLVKEKFFFF